MNSVEILDKKDQLKKEVRSLTDNARQEIRMLTDEEKERVEEIKNEIQKLNDELAELEKENENPTDEEKNNEQKNNSNRTMEKREFKLVEMLRNCVNGKPQDELNQAILEEGQKEMQRAGLPFQGQIQLPMETRTLSVETEHDNVVETELFNILEPLHSKSVLSQVGVKWLTGLQGDIQYPVMNTGISASWEAENAQTGDSTTTFTNIKLQPKRLSVVVPISKQLLLQTGSSVETAVRNEIINAISAKLEGTILGNGAGSENEPKGIFKNPTETTNIADFADICELEAGVETNNFSGEMNYILSPKAKAALRGMIKGTNATGMVFENGQIDGTNAVSTSFVEGTRVAYGDFSNLVIGQWAPVDIVIDNLTMASQGMVKLIVNTYFDAKVLRDGAIVTGQIQVGA